MPHFDYCDSLLTDLSANLTQRLQRVHNVCVRFICNIRRSDHVTSSLEQLSWLRLRDRRTFHFLSLIYNILHTSTPKYLSNRFSRLSDSQNFDTRSQQYSVLSIPLHYNYILLIFLHCFICQNLEFITSFYQRLPDAVTVQK